MSVINKMLQDLDKRHASGGDAALGVAQHLRPVQRRDFGEAFWRLMAGIMVVTVCWIGWVLWQMAPHSIVTQLAWQSGAKPHPAAAVSTTASAHVANVPAPVNTPAAAPTVVAAAQSTPSDAPSSAAPARAMPVPQPSESEPVDMLKLASVITTPIAESHPKPAVQKVATAEKAKRAAKSAKRTAIYTAPADAKIDKRMNSSPQENAEADFRRAATYINQGRIAEAMDALNAALAADPTHVPARQTAVGLLLEGRRVDEAQRLLQEGLALDPGQSHFAMLLARIQVERGDLNGALATLQKYAVDAGNLADYQAFTAALLQRLARHKEAAEAYETALRLQPEAGVWWMGLGISQQALNQPREAMVSYQRARASGTLSPDLGAFVDQRLKQIR